MKTLASIRKSIDEIDKEILTFVKLHKKTKKTNIDQVKKFSGPFRYVLEELSTCCTISPLLEEKLIKRRALVTQAGECKEKKKISSFRLMREFEILYSATQFASKNSLPVANLYRVFREIISSSLAHELKLANRQLRFLYLGPEGSYSHLATQLFIGRSIPQEPIASVEVLIQAVLKDDNAFAVLPIENSTSGYIFNHSDLVVKPLKILGEILLPIHHHLLSRAKKLSNIKTIYAHEQSLLQCSAWLKRAIPGATIVPCASNSKAAELVARSRAQTVGAIASFGAAQHYQIPILASNIQDFANNTTRFVVIGHAQDDWSSKHLPFKSSLVVLLPHVPGSLHSFIKKLKSTNITRIDSRPNPQRPFQYHFYIDFECKKPNIDIHQKVINKISKHVIRNYGSYPVAVLRPSDL
ncbi:MAG: prephenate dehydratase domain-containing protein [Methylacidiphilales bacterium]|nr:prephenate dehydratase domain-containing protein [Candidatus Methylacidiphilales bacterium]